MPMFFKYTEGNISYSGKARDIGLGGVGDLMHAWKLFERESGGPVSGLIKIALRYALKIPRE